MTEPPMGRTQLRIWQDAVRGRKGRERIRRRAAFNQHRRSMTMPVTDIRPEWLAYAMANPDVAPDPPICVIHGPRPVVAGPPDHPGTSGWGKVQRLDGSWLSCIRCGDCGAVLLIDNEDSLT